MTANKRIFLNVIATYGRSLYALACGLFTARWVLMTLGEVDYGLIGVVGGLAGFMTFFNGLMSSAVSRFYAFAVGQSAAAADYDSALDECRRWFNAAVAIHTLVPITSILVGYPIGEWAVRHYISIPPDRIEACVWVFRITCLNCLVGMMSVPYNAMYTAKQEIAELTIYGFITTTLNVIFLLHGHSRIRLVRHLCRLDGISEHRAIARHHCPFVRQISGMPLCSALFLRLAADGEDVPIRRGRRFHLQS